MTDLEEKARAATPGPWERLEGFAEPGHPSYKPGQYVVRIVQKRAPGQTDFVRLALVDGEGVYANAAFIAAANPSRILELIEENNKLREALSQARNQVVAFALAEIGAERAVKAVEYIDAALGKGEAG